MAGDAPKLDQAKLAKMQQSVRTGKGTPRRKAKKVHKTTGTDDKKLQTSLKKLNVQPIQAIEEVNMFKEDGNVIHFAAPKGELPFRPIATFSAQKRTSLSHLSFPTTTCVFNSRLHASVPSNTFAIYGAGEDKELTELVPGILNQLGPDSLASLRKLAESYQSLQKKDGSGGGGEGGNKKDGGDDEDEDDDDIPDLVEGENFESKVE
ncbi:Nascent polypeptide-associated complex subunit beta [Pseudocyphellaria aurata]|nr:Nascent polypeptide-associated complex subunit beta [Pseudocyphellaria aurata]